MALFLKEKWLWNLICPLSLSYSFFLSCRDPSYLIAFETPQVSEVKFCQNCYHKSYILFVPCMHFSDPTEPFEKFHAHGNQHSVSSDLKPYSSFFLFFLNFLQEEDSYHLHKNSFLECYLSLIQVTIFCLFYILIVIDLEFLLLSFELEV